MSRRTCLSNVVVGASTHPGLWLDRFLVGDAFDAPAKAELIAQAAKVKPCEGYLAAFKRRKSNFDADPQFWIFCVEAEGRVAIGLGAKGPVENGITLEHTWGVPILPASALKGLAAAAARKLADAPEWNLDGESYRELFGTTEASGCVDFHDAWWDPTEGGFPLAPDVMTVHHPDYYQKGDVPPTDFDSPTPIPFMTASGSFLVAIGGPTAWRDAARNLLTLGLRELGIGGKTNAGYGRFLMGDLEGRQGEEARRIESAKVRLEAAKRDLPAQLKGPETARDILGRVLAFATAGVAEAELRTLGEAVYAKNPRLWDAWAKDSRRNEDERRDFATYLEPRRVVVAVTPEPAVRAEVVKRREPVQAYGVVDKKERLEVTVIGQTRTLKQQSIRDAVLLARLRASSKESPVACIAVFDGDRLVALESEA